MNKELLLRAQRHWDALEKFRNDRDRCKRYTYGRQWGDTVCVDGSSMTEEEYIRRQGNIPLKNNLIRRIVRNVLGVFRNQYSPPEDSLPDSVPPHKRDTLCNELGRISALNDLEELYSRTMEEFLISGLAVHRKWFGWRNGKCDCWTDYVQPDYFFIDTDMRDFRGWDASIVGELHDIGFDELVCRLATKESDFERLRRIYNDLHSPHRSGDIQNPFGSELPSCSFYYPSSPSRCRVIEIWDRRSVPMLRVHDTRDGSLRKMPAKEGEKYISAENERRVRESGNPGFPKREPRLLKGKWFLEERWHYSFLSPAGDILAEGDSPYPHGSHPYIFKAYPFIDGEIHSFVSDLIDQQRYINRLVTLYDWIMRASAKGVLLFPEGSLPEGVDIDDISSEWSRFNGVILFRPKPGVPLPQQISGNAANVGITELLNVQLKMMEDVSGVNSALQGKLDSGAVSGTLYNQQTRHALTGLLDILQSFNTFIRDGMEKDLSNLSLSLPPL